MSSPRETVVPHLRAAIVLFHLVAITLMAVPAPGGGMQKSAWKDPTVQGEFEAWTERLNAFGLDVTQDEVEDKAWDVSVAYMAKRKGILAPFQLYYTATGTQQSWRMFVAPHRFPARLRIDLEEGGGWRTIYLARDPDLDWRERQLGHDRMRSAIFRFAWKPYLRYYETFCDWVADRAAEDFPEATRVRVLFLKYKTPTPQMVQKGRKPKVDEIQTTVRTLAERR